MEIGLMRFIAYELRRRCNVLASSKTGNERRMYLDAAEGLDPGHGNLYECVVLPVSCDTAIIINQILIQEYANN